MRDFEAVSAVEQVFGKDILAESLKGSGFSC